MTCHLVYEEAGMACTPANFNVKGYWAFTASFG
jgi:hypothetical protein